MRRTLEWDFVCSTQSKHRADAGRIWKRKWQIMRIDLKITEKPAIQEHDQAAYFESRFVENRYFDGNWRSRA